MTDQDTTMVPSRAEQTMTTQPATEQQTQPSETPSAQTLPPSAAPPFAPKEPSPQMNEPEKGHAPPLGTRIEVLWKIAHEDGTIEERWWGAVVQDRTTTTVGSLVPEHASKRIHILLYDSYKEFEEDVSRVAFLPNGVLLDVTQIHDENKGMLDWRVEEDVSQAPMSLTDVVEANAATLAEAGVPDDADLRYLAEMPAHVQMHMTSGYRVFADGVREMLAELSEKHPEGYVVTENDVLEMCARIKR